MQFKQPLTAYVVGALGLAVSAGAFAQDGKPQDKRFYVAPMVSYGFFKNDTIGKSGDQFGRVHLSNDNSIGGTLAIGKPVNSWLNLELYGFYFDPGQKINGHDAGNADLYGFGLDALFFPARDTFPVYAILGASWGRDHPGYDSITYKGKTSDTGNNGDAQFLDAGVGYMYTIDPYGLKVRAEYRFRYTTIHINDILGSDYPRSHYNDHIVSLGLQIPPGKPPQAAPPPPPPPPQKPVDSDGDGVPDSIDQCPGTPPGVQVDARGCPIQKTAPIVLKGVTFNFDSSKLTQQAQSRLDNVVDALKASPNVDFRIDGYTDSIGTKKYNKGLSQRRVNSVRQYLVDHGINATRITGTMGHGEADPVASNATAAGRAQNRRVELHVTNQGSSSGQGTGPGMGPNMGNNPPSVNGSQSGGY
jgi:OOP family OmpA-OmpF porin